MEVAKVDFVGIPTQDVCHMALFKDPDGNALMLHNRYKPYEVSDAQS